MIDNKMKKYFNNMCEIVDSESDEEFINRVKSKLENVWKCKIDIIDPIEGYGLSLFRVNSKQLDNSDIFVSLAGKDIFEDYFISSSKVIKEISIKASFKI